MKWKCGIRWNSCCRNAAPRSKAANQLIIDTAHSSRGGSRTKQGYSRLALPLWGQGRIGMLLVAFTWG